MAALYSSSRVAPTGVGLLAECLYGYELAGDAAIETERRNRTSLDREPWEEEREAPEEKPSAVASSTSALPHSAATTTSSRG
ncbi:hypothetical protein OsI_26634 [Oryza sativa Indica Group]|uniref:Uncharacterized protein n=1 Tax=Oryza sativa subsp. indica TaxID=39946 RepID=B8B7T3_ORYSI|nr:hypothetical protein OsI_26634 [Oryza sativa Indica Group]